MKRRLPWCYDRALLFSVLIAVGFGLLMIASASAVYASIRFDDQYFFLRRQFFPGVVFGIAAMIVLMKIDYHFWKPFAVPAFLVSLLALGLVFVPGLGTSAYGSTSWLNLGLFSFQPSEMAKFGIILYLAAWLSSRGKHRVSNVMEGLAPFLFVLGLMGFFIYQQPDVGTLSLVVAISFVLFFAAGAQLSHIFALGMLGIVGLFAMIKAAPYRWDRFMVFLNPELDPLGKGYQINQALIALGSGGLLGVGLGESRQKFNYLPEPAGDSIFAIIGEELGFIGAIAVIALFVFIVYRGLRIAAGAPDEFGRLLAIGIVSWIALQAILNIGAITGMLPLTGVPLPFISYGGTSLVFLLAAVGVLLNISAQAKCR
jgi:cell division protein FtsW